jgi:hypothetical protein
MRASGVRWDAGGLARAGFGDMAEACPTRCCPPCKTPSSGRSCRSCMSRGPTGSWTTRSWWRCESGWRRSRGSRRGPGRAGGVARSGAPAEPVGAAGRAGGGAAGGVDGRPGGGALARGARGGDGRRRSGAGRTDTCGARRDRGGARAGARGRSRRRRWQRPGCARPALDLAALRTLLDGPHAAARAEVRAFLAEPGHRASFGISTAEQRALCHGWLQELARRGFGDEAFPGVTTAAPDVGGVHRPLRDAGVRRPEPADQVRGAVRAVRREHLSPRERRAPASCLADVASLASWSVVLR